MRLNNKSLCKHIITALSLGSIVSTHASSVDNVDTNIDISQSGDGDLSNNARILIGEPAKKEDFPYFGVLKTIGEATSRSCGASLISNRVAVTAASCLFDEDGKVKQDLSLTSVYIDIGDTKSSAVSFLVLRKIHIHPEFSPVNLENDIAVIELGSSETSFFAAPVAIYSGNLADDMDLVTVGWNITSGGQSMASGYSLSKITQPPSSSSFCKDANPNWLDNNKNLICTMLKDIKGLGNGDRGNPLTYENNGVNLLVGIASNSLRSGDGAAVGPEDAQPNYYTHVYSYIDWIVKVSGLKESYLLDTTARPSPGYLTATATATATNINTNTDKNTSGDQNTSTSASTILQSTGFTLAILLLSLLALLF
ncbi:Trypsin-1 [Zancudomyces culisetae]|uniref:Trypsin-1 n=1 Tax=Zancudomyces culisetae TaxID=1213189 RepID=A0A1R1PFC3_ZANCU|nr:Trypsin-1 [Zancudomyces culisetae]|eukprot:OMH79671.1 Trypsin-1 [Zancudomyces culisetae]